MAFLTVVGYCGTNNYSSGHFYRSNTVRSRLVKVTKVKIEMKVNGKEVTNIEDYPEGMRHLHPDAKPLACNTCGKKTYGGKLFATCNFPSPEGIICKGIFQP